MSTRYNDTRDQTLCWISKNSVIYRDSHVEALNPDYCHQPVQYVMRSIRSPGAKSYVCKEHGETWETHPSGDGWRINRHIIKEADMPEMSPP